MEFAVSVDGEEAGRFRPWREDCAANPNGHLQHGARALVASGQDVLEVFVLFCLLCSVFATETPETALKRNRIPQARGRRAGTGGARAP